MVCGMSNHILFQKRKIAQKGYFEIREKVTFFHFAAPKKWPCSGPLPDAQGCSSGPATHQVFLRHPAKERRVRAYAAPGRGPELRNILRHLFYSLCRKNEPLKPRFPCGTTFRFQKFIREFGRDFWGKKDVLFQVFGGNTFLRSSVITTRPGQCSG